MYMRKMTLGPGRLAPPSWWFLAEEALSLWVTPCAAKVAEDAAGTPRAFLIPMMLSG